jgi:hypothetical protein
MMYNRPNCWVVETGVNVLSFKFIKIEISNLNFFIHQVCTITVISNDLESAFIKCTLTLPKNRCPPLLSGMLHLYAFK